MLYISLAFSAVLILVTLVAVLGAKEPRRVYLKVWFGMLFGIIPGACVLPAYLLHALLFALAATVCRVVGVGRRGFVAGSIAAFILSYAIVGGPKALELWRAEKEYPLESLEARLARLAPRTSVGIPSPAGKPAEETTDMGDAWTSNQNDAQRREWALRALHENCLQLFVDAPGFGVVRMYGPTMADIRRADAIRDAKPLDLPEPPKAGTNPPLSTGELMLGPVNDASTVTIDRKSMQRVHGETTGGFLNPLGFGYVRDREHVAGFISHRFTEYPPKPTKPEGDGHWRFESLDLISLLKHPQPVAYVSKHLPRMDELANAPTRPLDEFEAESLPKLRAGEELASAQGPQRVRMIGAIRARSECLKCHTAESGELLGAFSYDLRRDRP